MPLQSKLPAPHSPAPKSHSPVWVVFFQFGQLPVEVILAVVNVTGDLRQHLLNRNTLAHILNGGADGIQDLFDIWKQREHSYVQTEIDTLSGDKEKSLRFPHVLCGFLTRWGSIPSTSRAKTTYKQQPNGAVKESTDLVTWYWGCQAPSTNISQKIDK